MTWPPSCHAASPWSTLTPRTSPSSMKETGWSDVDGRDVKKRKRKKKKQRWWQRTNVFRCPPNPQTLHSTPRHQRVLSTLGRIQTSLSPTFPLSSFFFFFYLVISLSCCGLSSERNLQVSLICLSSVSGRSFSIHSFLHYHTYLFLLDFL